MQSVWNTSLEVMLLFVSCEDLSNKEVLKRMFRPKTERK